MAEARESTVLVVRNPDHGAGAALYGAAGEGLSLGRCDPRGSESGGDVRRSASVAGPVAGPRLRRVANLMRGTFRRSGLKDSADDIGILAKRQALNELARCRNPSR
jgi:hypothetical protein